MNPVSVPVDRPAERRSLLAYVARCGFCDKTVSMLSPDYAAQWRHRTEFDADDPTAREVQYYCPNHRKQAEIRRPLALRIRRKLGL